MTLAFSLVSLLSMEIKMSCTSLLLLQQGGCGDVVGEVEVDDAGESVLHVHFMGFPMVQSISR